jgi:hypothetical protein
MPRAVVTLASRSHLPFARALAMSVNASNPGLPVYVLLVDGNAGEDSDKSEPFKLIFLSQLPDQATVRRMSFQYAAFEFCNALKGHLSQFVMEELKPEQWIYLDSDIMVCGSLQPIWQAIDTGPIVITPHCTRPIPGSDVGPYELNLIKHGVYNGGLMGMKNRPETGRFLNWFASRLSRFAFYDDAAGSFVDQTWMTLIPCLFESTVICRHPGVNIGHWNLHERTLTRADDGTFLSNGLPVVCVHFSGWDFSNPEKISKFALPHLNPVPPEWAAIGLRYRELLTQAGYDPAVQVPYGFGCFSDRREITSRMRKGYLADLDAGLAPADPFNSAVHFYIKYPPRYYRVRQLLPAWMERKARAILGR